MGGPEQVRAGCPEPPSFDLQSHSTHSDGALPPAEVVSRAVEAGVRLLALSDHDTVSGVDEALAAATDSAAAGEATALAIVPAVEISALDGSREDLHVLGYGIDHRDESLLDALEAFRADRVARADRMARALVDLGLALDERVLDAKRASGGAIGRPHLARAVFDEPLNASRLAAEGLRQPEQVLQAYLLPGRPAYRQRTRPSIGQAIELIHAAGGVAVWAHPFWDIAAPDEVLSTLSRFARDGLDGVEAFYITHDRAQAELLDEAARRLDLLTTGSSDFHGPDHAIFSRFRAFSLFGRSARLGPIAQRSEARSRTGF
jgi:predicted metal-dependent phosphoesterase TrpH